VPASAGLPAYPLRGLLDAGLPLAICTDNPGISRTTLADEFIAAARIGGGLTLWEALTVVRSAFVNAFLPAGARERLLATADARVFRLLGNDPDGPRRGGDR
jgi:adenosine deaminase